VTPFIRIVRPFAGLSAALARADVQVSPSFENQLAAANPPGTDRHDAGRREGQAADVGIRPEGRL